MIDPNMQPALDDSMGRGMDPAAGVELPPEPPVEELPQEPIPEEQPPAPADPFTAAIDAILDMPDADAVRRVYAMATSAARAKVKLQAATDRQSSRDYHAVLASSPEVRHHRVLIATRRRLDTLAQERRRLSMARLDLERRGKSTSVHDLQIDQLSRAMGLVAGGALLYVAAPEGFNSEGTP